MESLAQNFSNHFKVALGITRQQKRYAFAIRYQVYAKELGWEPLNDSHLETDVCDDYAHHCLLEHRRSGDIAGCVRLVMPSLATKEAKLPCQLHHVPMVTSQRQALLTTENIGEISRLAVPGSFRRRAHEAGKPFVLDEHNSTSLYTEEERRNFPNISIGLYLSAIAMVEICNLDRVLVVMEPRLQRHLKRYGLVFHQISEIFELRGKRALFELPRNELTINMEEGIKSLYQFIKDDLSNQWLAYQELIAERQQANDQL
jgi:N-acyl amino acid synthase of PEP-CTERM/exosortase system